MPFSTVPSTIRAFIQPIYIARRLTVRYAFAEYVVTLIAGQMVYVSLDLQSQILLNSSESLTDGVNEPTRHIHTFINKTSR